MLIMGVAVAHLLMAGPDLERPAPASHPAPVQRLAKRLKEYDFCGREAILRNQDIPRRYRLRAKFGADGQGTEGWVESSPLKMLNACVRNRTQYIYLGTPPEARAFEVEVSLSFAHLRPKGKPETRDDQWGIKD